MRGVLVFCLAALICGLFSSLAEAGCRRRCRSHCKPAAACQPCQPAAQPACQPCQAQARVVPTILQMVLPPYGNNCPDGQCLKPVQK